MMKGILLLSVLFPIIAGVLLLLLPESIILPKWPDGTYRRNGLLGYTAAALGLGAALTGWSLFRGTEAEVTLLFLNHGLELALRPDGIGRLFAAVSTIVWVLAGIFSFAYMKHETHEKRYFGFYLITYGVIIGLDLSGNLITMYLFYELMTLVSLPLVLHNGTREAVMAGMKYLAYSFAGAYMALFGLFFLYRNCTTLDFVAGGSLDMETLAAAGQSSVLLVAAFLMIVGYGVKAGMFPLHAWLPTAHPVAPAPASAALSGVIAKGGVLAIIRVIYYVLGMEFIKGTWVQYTWIVLALLTVFMGSMLACRETVLKKRLAYSTVSQISYILLGLSLLEPCAMTGALLQVAFHAVTKAALFLCAGAFISCTGRANTEELAGIGRQMPVTLWCYTFAALALIGIPPFCGFVGKWYLATGALSAEGIGVLSYIAPAVLLLSALLTAAYLLPVSIRGFLPGVSFDHAKTEKRREPLCMAAPLLVLAALTLLMGLFPNGLIQTVGTMIQPLF